MTRHGAVVFIHGYLDQPKSWQPLLEVLDLPGWTTLAVSLDAEAAASGSNALEAMAGQVRQQVAALQLGGGERLVIVGHSMGGQVAELVASAEGDRVAGLVLVTPAPLSGYTLTEDQAAAFRKAAHVKDADAVASARAARAVTVDDRVKQLLGATAAQTSVPASLAALAAWTQGHPAGKHRSPLQVPTLLVTSEDKFFTPEFLAAEAARRFEAFEFRRVPAAGHWPHVEQPAALAAILARFVRSLNAQDLAPAALQPVVDEIRQWFFRDYFDTWVAIGAGHKQLSAALDYWGAPMHVASVLQTKWLMTPADVLGQIEASQAPLKAAGYDHTVVIDSEITVYNPGAAGIDAIWSRRRADGHELQRIASHFEVHKTPEGWRVVALGNRLTAATRLEATRSVLRGLT